MIWNKKYESIDLFFKSTNYSKHWCEHHFLMQNVYMDKLAKKYEIIFDRKMIISLSIDQKMTSYKNKINTGLMNLYQKKLN